MILYETLVLPLPPSVWVAGETLTAYGGAIGVTCGEPVVNGPWAEVAFSPSLTIALTFFLSASAMLTVSCTDVLPPWGERTAARDRSR